MISNKHSNDSRAPAGALAVFVKTPQYSPIKTRLAQDIGADQATRHYIEFVKRTESLLQSFQQKNPQWKIFWAVAEKEAIKDPLWSSFATIALEKEGFAERLGNTYNNLVSDFGQAILMGADSPHLPLSYLHQALQLQTDYVFGPCEDGGFYLLLGKKTIPLEIWQKVPWSKENTLDVFSHLIGKESISYLPTSFDIDTLKDLQRYQQLSNEN